jgi:hypothetical protein
MIDKDESKFRPKKEIPANEETDERAAWHVYRPWYCFAVRTGHFHGHQDGEEDQEDQEGKEDRKVIGRNQAVTGVFVKLGTPRSGSVLGKLRGPSCRPSFLRSLPDYKPVSVPVRAATIHLGRTIAGRL